MNGIIKNLDVSVNGFKIPIINCDVNFGTGFVGEIQIKLLVTHEMYKKIIDKEYLPLDVYDRVEAEPKEIIRFILESLNLKDLDNAQKWANLLNDKLKNDEISV